jgi:hypothetical protein
MADNTIVHMGENSPEQVAFKLLHEIAQVEGKVFHTNPSEGRQTADRRWILSTYRECLKTVKGHLTPNNKASGD